MRGPAPSRSVAEPPKPYQTPFLQQDMHVWRPRLTLPWVVGTLFGAGVLFLALGAAVTAAGSAAAQQTVRYDNAPSCEGSEGGTCVVDVTVAEDMEAPVFFSYKLTGFHQNHRRYVKSRSDLQLRGEPVSERQLEDCKPLERHGDGFGGSANASVAHKYLYPCGLPASTMFTDTFGDVAVRQRGSGVFRRLAEDTEWLEHGIAWSTDLGKKFNPVEVDEDRFTRQSPLGFTMPPVDDEHFVVWMRPASEPSFVKLYARMPSTSLAAGDVLRVHVSNQYSTGLFDGTKSVVLSTAGWMGTADPFLGPAYLFYSFLCFTLAGLFVWRQRYLDDELRRTASSRMLCLPTGRNETRAPSLLEEGVSSGSGPIGAAR